MRLLLVLKNLHPQLQPRPMELVGAICVGNLLNTASVSTIWVSDFRQRVIRAVRQWPGSKSAKKTDPGFRLAGPSIPVPVVRLLQGNLQEILPEGYYPYVRTVVWHGPCA